MCALDSAVTDPRFLGSCPALGDILRQVHDRIDTLKGTGIDASRHGVPLGGLLPGFRLPAYRRVASWPLDVREGTNAVPTRPLAPVTRIFMETPPVICSPPSCRQHGDIEDVMSTKSFGGRAVSFSCLSERCTLLWTACASNQGVSEIVRLSLALPTAIALSSPHDAAQHPGEHQLMQWIQHVPIHQSQQANWLKNGGLTNRRACGVPLHLED